MKQVRNPGYFAGILMAFLLGYSPFSFAQFGLGQIPQLYTVTSGERSSNDAVIPISQSIVEWDISFANKAVREKTNWVEIEIPFEGESATIYKVRKYQYRDYGNGNKQWIGEIIPNSPIADKEYFGRIIINLIDDQPYGVISIMEDDYEIYTDNVVGTRIARVHSHGFGPDAIHSHGQTTANYGPDSGLGEIPEVSTIDILVLIDSDLNPAVMQWRVINEKMNMDAILSMSGSEGNRGVPLDMNIVGIHSIDVPSNLEDVSIELINNQWVSDAFNTFTDELSPTSVEIINRRESAGADLVALYVPFDPEPTPNDPNYHEICGIAGIPKESSHDSQFSNSFTLHASNCTAAQFVFMHEIIHNFGANHVYNPVFPEDAFEEYAYGIHVDPGGGEEVFSTLMGCIFLVGEDPSETDCNRIFRLSDPQDSYDGFQVGNAQFADNVRFLSECGPGACRREQVADRKASGGSGNMPPIVNILTPPDNAAFLATGSYQLTANAKDDFGIMNVVWSIHDGSTNSVVGMGTGNNYSIHTSEFSTPGEYVVSAAATDGGGRITSVSHTVNVVEQADMEVDGCSDGPQYNWTIQNNGPGTAIEGVVVDITYGFMGVIHTVSDPDMPDFCYIVPYPPGTNCPNNHCDTVVRCHLPEMLSSDSILIDQTVCVQCSNKSQDDMMGSSTYIEIADLNGNVDPDMTNNIAGSPVSCD